MQEFLFYLFSALSVVCAMLVVLNPFTRNPVTSAMFLVLTIASMAGLFVLLHAYFLAAVQILVYAGAVMVLFLFVIMLLDLREEQRRSIKLFGLAGGGISILALLGVFALTMFKRQEALRAAKGAMDGSTRPLGRLLFTDYVLPFELLSILLLAAMVGVILLSKKDVE